MRWEGLASRTPPAGALALPRRPAAVTVRRDGGPAQLSWKRHVPCAPLRASCLPRAAGSSGFERRSETEREQRDHFASGLRLYRAERRSGRRESNPRDQLGRLGLKWHFAGIFFAVGKDLGKSGADESGFRRSRADKSVHAGLVRDRSAAALVLPPRAAPARVVPIRAAWDGLAPTRKLRGVVSAALRKLRVAALIDAARQIVGEPKTCDAGGSARRNPRAAAAPTGSDGNTRRVSSPRLRPGSLLISRRVAHRRRRRRGWSDRRCRSRRH